MATNHRQRIKTATMVAKGGKLLFWWKAMALLRKTAIALWYNTPVHPAQHHGWPTSENCSPHLLTKHDRNEHQILYQLNKICFFFSSLRHFSREKLTKSLLKCNNFVLAMQKMKSIELPTTRQFSMQATRRDQSSTKSKSQFIVKFKYQDQVQCHMKNSVKRFKPAALHCWTGKIPNQER